MPVDLSKLSDEELDRAIASKKGGGSLADLSDQELDSMIERKRAEGMEKTSIPESIYRGASQGTTLGFQDEQAGVANALTKGGLAENLPTAVKSALLLPFGGAMAGAKLGDVLAGKTNLSGVAADYKAARDDERMRNSAAREDNPWAYGLSEFAGSVVPSITAPGAKALTIPKMAGSGALIAGTMGAGASEADSAKGVAYDTVKNAAIGGALGAGIGTAAKAAKYIPGAAKKIASSLTGLTEKEIATYASRADEVKSLMKRAGGDVAEAADEVRRTIGRDIQIARQDLGAQIGQALDDPKYAQTIVDASPLLTKLDEMITSVSKTTARFRPDEVNELKNVRDLVAQSLDQNGGIGLRALSEIKEELQNIAKPSYNNGSLIFSRGDLAAKGSKGAAGEARRLLNAAAPEIKQANNQLSMLHRIEETMNKNLIREGKPEAALLAAGSGSNPRSAKTLARIDEITGGQGLRQAENLAAGRTFGNTSLLPVDVTGKAMARMAAGGGVGTILGGPVGTVLGTALTSPATTKLTIDAGRFLGRLGRAVGNKTPKAPIGAGRQAVMSGAVKEVSGAERHAESSIERRLQELKKKRNTKSDAG